MSTNTWEPISIPSTDLTAIRVTTATDTIYVYNIYNDQKHSDTLRLLNTETKMHMVTNRNRGRMHALWLGDFNRDSPVWDEPRDSHLFTAANLASANYLINVVSQLDLLMILPRYLPTLCASRTKNETRPDNVFGSSTLFSPRTTTRVH